MCWWNNCKSFNDPTRRELFLKGDSSIFSRGTWRKVRKALIRLWACACVSPPMCTSVTMYAFGRRFVSLCLLLCFHSCDSVRVMCTAIGDMISEELKTRGKSAASCEWSSAWQAEKQAMLLFFYKWWCHLCQYSPPQTVFDNPSVKPWSTGRQPVLLYIFTTSMAGIGIFDKHCVEHNEEAVSLSWA